MEIFLYYFSGVVIAWGMLKLFDIPSGSTLGAIIKRLIFSLFSWLLVVVWIIAFGVVLIFSAPFWKKKGAKWL